jgi:alkyl hydroperoxide reductase subunit AhpF
MNILPGLWKLQEPLRMKYHKSRAHYRRLGVPGEDDLIGANIHFCATCDGAFYKGKKVLVVGGS